MTLLAVLDVPLPAGLGVTLAVPDASSGPQPWMSVVQITGYAALLLAVGLVWFRVFIVGMIGRRTFVDAVDAPTVRLAWAAAAIATVTHVLLIPLHTAHARGEPVSAIVDADMWRVGIIDPTVRAVTFIVAGLAVEILFARRAHASRTARWATLLGGLVALGSMTIVGHTAEVGPTWTMHGADFVHGVVAATWFGGLIGLIRYLRRAMRARAEAGAADAAAVVARFSWIAGWSMLGLAVSGLVMGSRILGSFDALRDSEYGRLLIAKVLVVLVVVALAGWNRFRLVPAIEREAASCEAWGQLRTIVAAEGALLLAVLGITGFLVVANPAG